MPEQNEVLFERGHPIKKREDLGLVQIVLADDAARSLRQIASSQKREQFEGKVDKKTLICSGNIQLINLLKEEPFTPWAKVNFLNNGPNTALVSINSAQDWNSIDSGDQLDMDFLKAEKRINLIYYKTNQPGETATTIATGKW